MKAFVIWSLLKAHLHRSPARLWLSEMSHPKPVREMFQPIMNGNVEACLWIHGKSWHLALNYWNIKASLRCIHKAILAGRTSSNITLIVSTVEQWAAIWLSICSDLSRISPIWSVLMMEWCLVRSRCSSCTWSFRFWMSVWRVCKHTTTHI